MKLQHFENHGDHKLNGTPCHLAQMRLVAMRMMSIITEILTESNHQCQKRTGCQHKDTTAFCSATPAQLTSVSKNHKTQNAHQLNAISILLCPTKGSQK